IIGFTGTLLMKLPGPLNDEQEHQLKVIQSSGRHLLSLINDILDLAKIESGKVEVHFEPVPAGAVVDEVVSALAASANAKGLSLQAEVTQEEALPMTDRRALHQILINLVSNAIKYTDSGGVRVQLVRDDTSVRINVIDTGPGIKESDRSKLFTAFEQLDASSTRRFDGAGLGLYLSKKLATLLGAQLELATDTESGSTFSLTLPPELAGTVK
ncbi:MAG: hypothetical protein JOZ38_09515, partial [Candidatus Eremiobacteraeota bacterium]|nr:hypothetical protein [Candidatus Eremiobacteraeota bacterium]